MGWVLLGSVWVRVRFCRIGTSPDPAFCADSTSPKFINRLGQIQAAIPTGDYVKRHVSRLPVASRCHPRGFGFSLLDGSGMDGSAIIIKLVPQPPRAVAGGRETLATPRDDSQSRERTKGRGHAAHPADRTGKEASRDPHAGNGHGHRPERAHAPDNHADTCTASSTASSAASSSSRPERQNADPARRSAPGRADGKRSQTTRPETRPDRGRDGNKSGYRTGSGGYRHGPTGRAEGQTGTRTTQATTSTNTRGHVATGDTTRPAWADTGHDTGGRGRKGGRGATTRASHRTPPGKRETEEGRRPPRLPDGSEPDQTGHTARPPTHTPNRKHNTAATRSRHPPARAATSARRAHGRRGSKGERRTRQKK